MFVRLNCKIVNSGQIKEVWYVFETEHETMIDLHADLVRDGSICGIRYDTRGDGPGRRVVTAEQAAVVTREVISTIMEFNETLVDQDGDLIWEAE